MSVPVYSMSTLNPWLPKQVIFPAGSLASRGWGWFIFSLLGLAGIRPAGTGGLNVTFSRLGPRGRQALLDWGSYLNKPCHFSGLSINLDPKRGDLNSGGKASSRHGIYRYSFSSFGRMYAKLGTTAWLWFNLIVFILGFEKEKWNKVDVKMKKYLLSSHMYNLFIISLQNTWDSLTQQAASGSDRGQIEAVNRFVWGSGLPWGNSLDCFPWSGGMV